MKLIIAEKPSVAFEIANVLKVKTKAKGYIYNEDYYISWCVGHLVELAMPEKYDQNFKKWNLDDLPIIPNQFQYIVSEKTKDQYNVLKNLIDKEEVDEVICATDSGREGELIFRLVYNQTKSKKTVKRLWISSLEKRAIKQGFESLKSSDEYDNLYYSALGRQQADWIVGLNATRLYTCIYKTILPIGRVQSPTVAFIVKRQQEIKNFISKPFYTIYADCCKFKASTRVEDENKAKEIVHKCNEKTAKVVKIEKNKKNEKPPKLFDLTSLQKEANKIFGYTAKQTLDIVQCLYESKLCTYPRTDSQYLTEDMKDRVFSLIQNIANLNILDLDSSYDVNKVVISNVINDNKVTDHHAIIPTEEILTNKSEQIDEKSKNILNLIAYRLFQSTYISCKFISTKIVLDIEGQEFIENCKQVIDPGFKIIGKKSKEEDNDITILEQGFDVFEGQTFDKVPVGSVAGETKPPKPYTEATLLEAMELAGTKLEDNALKEVMKDSGLGTPATRAGIIEKIIKLGFVERSGKNLLATQKGLSLIECLSSELIDAKLTAQWEQKLEEIAQGKLSLSTFIKDIEVFTQKLIEANKNNTTKETLQWKKEKESIGKCPRCGKNVVEFSKTFSCESGKDGCGFVLWKTNKFFESKKKSLTKKIVKDFLSKGESKLKGLYSEKTGKTYDAIVQIEDTGKYVNYKLVFDEVKR